jgi:hypothetical protein
VARFLRPSSDLSLCVLHAQLGRLHTMQRSVDMNAERVYETAKRIINDLDSEMRQIREDASL